jgi:putative Mn2+ efflux pump MntP
MLALLVVAVALGLNNFGAAIAIGVTGVDRRTEIKVATVFGLCDVVMPAAGMLIGTRLAGPLGSAARWAGAGILFVTAVWGLVEALRGGDDAPKAWHGWRLLVSGAALSLDDLAVGLALGTVRYPIVLAVILFGLMSFVMSIIGLKLGGKLGAAAGEHGEIVGAIILIGISGAMAMGWLLPGLATMTTAEPTPSGSRIDGPTLTGGDCGLATARNSTRPPAQQRTPAAMTRPGRRRAQTSVITTANSCITKPAMSTVIPMTQIRLAARSAKSFRSSGGRFATLWVARCSMTSDAPNVMAPAIATSTATRSLTADPAPRSCGAGRAFPRRTYGGNTAGTGPS